MPPREGPGGPAAHPTACLPLLPSGPDGVHKSGLRWAWPNVLHGNGGDDRDRTDDLLVANEALSQLSYIPTPKRSCVADSQPRGRPDATSAGDTSRLAESVKPCSPSGL